MQLHFVDIAIIGLYLVAVVFIGFWLSRRAAVNLDSYFLGGKNVPWYLLGVSNASSMFDITGTMWLVYIVFVYGMKGVWLPWLWPTYNQIFLMVYLSVWIRRSGVLTGGEWMSTRFGAAGGELARISVVIFALVSVIGFLSYGFKGIGKFAAVILPWQLSPDAYAIIIMSVTTIYVILGGMYSVVFTDVVQFVLLTLVSIYIGATAFLQVAPAQLTAVVPAGWRELFFGWQLDLDWSNLIPAVNEKIAADGYGLFAIFFMMMMFKGILNSMAGPSPNYDMQRILATRRPKESALMSWVVSICLMPRWLMITGITVLALVFFGDEIRGMGTDIDFEMILPYVINNFIPVGVLGLLIAGLFAGFMSTFDSTVNAGAAYLVVDVYKRYFKPDASQKRYIMMSYLSSILVVAVGLFFGLLTESINTAMQWIVSGLWGGYTAPNFLKWHWWRFNGHGYFWGMVTGIAVAMILPLALPELSALNGFPIILAISGGACIAASLLSAPESDEILKKFYRQVRPWGLWKPVHEKVLRENPAFAADNSFWRDMGNVAVGIVWQLSLVLVPVYLVIHEINALLTSAAVLLVTSVLLKKLWYDRLED